MARKRSHEEHENHERWLVSYADFITLLFAFFVVMYAVSSVNEGKYRVLSESLVAAFRSPMKSLQPIQVGAFVRSPYSEDVSVMKRPSPLIPVAIPISKPPVNLPMKTESRAKSEPPVPQVGQERMPKVMGELAAQLEQAMESLIELDLVTVRRGALWVEVEIKNQILFPSGSAELQTDAVPVLETIAKVLRRFPNPVQVEGFTDNVPIHTVAFPSNWELSAARAASVVHLFTQLGIRPERMAAIGYGEHRPIADNSTVDGRRTNRRVVLVILSLADMDRVLALLRAEGDHDIAGQSQDADVRKPPAASRKRDAVDSAL